MNNAVSDTMSKAVNRIHPALYRISRGKVGGSLRRAPVLLLTTTGRKSGKQRTVPLLYLKDGDRLAVVASYGGDDRNPAWLHNLQANPNVGVEVDGTTRQMTATVADDAERDRLWPQLVAMYSGYDSYQAKTERRIPVVLLSPS